jgi:TonB family protein
MLPLPILNVRLQACPESWQQMTPTARGRHCSACDTEVIDFTRHTAAELEAARAAAPGGHLCGRFRAGQLAGGQPVGVVLRPKLRRFLVVLVLVCGLGLTSQEAWAQVRQLTKAPTYTPPADLLLLSLEELSPLELPTDGTSLLPPLGVAQKESIWLGMIAEQMPIYKDGGQQGLINFIKQHLSYPPQATKSGKVFISFLVTTSGTVQDVRVLRGLEPSLNAAAVAVVRSMGLWEPGKQNGRAIDVRYTIPVTFSSK